VLAADGLEVALTAGDLDGLPRLSGRDLMIDEAAVDRLLERVAPRLSVAPQPGFYRLRGGNVTLEQAGRPGRTVELAAARERLVAGLPLGETRLVLPTVEVPAPEPPADLTFPDLLTQGTTYFGDSSADRYHNVALGLARINGALVAPGAAFSFNQASGPVTLAAGFRKGYGIAVSNGTVTTLPSVGGGICQVATTLFHAVFRAGLPIGERSWHLYWMPRYGRPPSGMTGLDATVDDQYGLDFTFVNATGSWLHVEAVAAGGEAIVRLRGVKPGWQVAIDGPSISNVVRADRTMVERPDPSLPAGRRLLVEHAEDGKTVAIRRRVRDGAGTLLEDRTFVAHYAPARNVTLVGTGGRIVA
jgi:vancomycin resistance protein YoaR